MSDFAEKICLRAVSSLVSGDAAVVSPLAGLSEGQWREVYATADEMGVTALQSEAVQMLPQSAMPPLDVLIPGLGAAAEMENHYRLQLEQKQRVTAMWRAEGLRVWELKGHSYAAYYPVPDHRNCGDFDAYVTRTDGSDHEWAYRESIRVARACGLEVDEHDYKHSHMASEDMMVENHRFCTMVRGERAKKELERHLEELITRGEAEYIEGTEIERPGRDFTALFMLTHAFQHFMVEGMSLKQILDWCFFLRAEQNRVDWEDFYHWTDRMGMTHFANILTWIAKDTFGLEITSPHLQYEQAYADRVLDDALHGGAHVWNQNYSPLRERWEKTRNTFAGAWKYHHVWHRSVLAEYAKTLWYYWTEKEVGID